MAVRAAMADIINYVERLVNDESNTNHTTQQIQDALDQCRVEARYWKLTPHETRATGGTITYKIFTADCGYWESDGSLLNYNFDALSPASSDWIVGRWEFSAEPTRPVYILGYTYDVYAAAADLLEVRGSQLAEDHQSFSVYNGSFTSTVALRKGSLELAAQYRKKQRSQFVTLLRSDLVP